MRRHLVRGQLGQQRGDLAAPTPGGVLVAHRRLRGRMAEALHQFGQARPGGGGQHGAGMA